MGDKDQATDTDPTPKKDFFISYTGDDEAWAEWIAWILEKDGYTCMLQAWDFRAGSNFVLKMQEAAVICERTIAVLSEDFLKSVFTAPEWAAAFVQDPTGKDQKLVQVRISKCEPTGLLAAIGYIDLVGLNEDAARIKLLKRVRKARGKPEEKPEFPGAPKKSGKPTFPGALPPVWNVPLPRNPNFTGRKELLTSLRSQLVSGETTALTQAISGLGGVGKTQLALEYAYRFASNYDYVWWVRAEEPVKLASDYAALAGELGLPEKDDANQNNAVAAVRGWLGQNGGWLLVFDNVPHPPDVQPFLPQGNTGHTIITSRDPVWGGVAAKLDVEVMEPEEAIVFLLRRTGDADKKTAAELAEQLGCLPLALEQAGAYIEASGESLTGYLEMFKERQAEMLKRGTPATGYEGTVATTWEISFKAVETESPAAADLLNLCAFLAPDDIPRKMISEGAEHLPDSLAPTVSDPLKFADALAVVRRYSLMGVTAETLSVHRLVQAVTRGRLDGDAQKTWAGAAVSLVNSAFPFDSDEVVTWSACELLLPHALATASHSENLGVELDTTGAVLNQSALYLWGRAQYTAAKHTLERALAIAEKSHGPEHPTAAIILDNLATIQFDLGDLSSARSNTERALAIGEKTYGPEYPTVAIRLNNLAKIQHALGDFESAKSNAERALAISEKTYGPEHPTVSIRLNNLAQIQKALGDLPSAKANTERALEIDEKSFGPEHPTVSIRLNNLAQLQKALGDRPSAKANMGRALEIDEKSYGPEHPNVAIDLSNLAGILREMGEESDAKAAEKRANEIRAKLAEGRATEEDDTT